MLNRSLLQRHGLLIAPTMACCTCAEGPHHELLGGGWLLGSSRSARACLQQVAPALEKGSDGGKGSAGCCAGDWEDKTGACVLMRAGYARRHQDTRSGAGLFVGCPFDFAATTGGPAARAARGHWV